MRRAVAYLLLFFSAGFLLAGCAVNGRQAAPTLSAPPAPAPTLKIRFVRFRTSDGLTLCGRIFGAGETAVILGHMFSAGQKSWLETARALSSRGYTVLTFDFRGYGLSGGVKEIPKTDKDLRAALTLMRRTNKQIFLVGAGMGGTAALKVAARTRVAGVATISAPDRFIGLAAGKISGIKGPKLFMAAASDDGAPETARRFYSETDEPKEIRILPGAEQGTDVMPDTGSEALRLLIDWLERND